MAARKAERSDGIEVVAIVMPNNSRRKRADVGAPCVSPANTCDARANAP